MREKIAQAMKAAMREKDQTRLATLRLLNAAIKDRDIAARSAGSSEAGGSSLLQLLQKMIKQREESARMYEEGGRLELAERERAEIAIIQEFLPTPLTEEETAAAISAAIEEIGADGIRDMGRVMALLKERHAGRLDAGKASAAVKKALGA